MTSNRAFVLGVACGCALGAAACDRDDGGRSRSAEGVSHLSLLEGGAASQLVGLPKVRLTVLEAATGQRRRTFLLDEGASCTVTHGAAGSAVRSTYDCSLTGGTWTNLHVIAEVDYEDGEWGTRATVRLTALESAEAAADALGLEIHLANTPETEHALYTAYSGGKVVDEPATAPGGPTPGRRDFSVQAIPYWADDGSALLVWAADPTGEEPKDIVARPVPGQPAALALGWEWLAPNAHLAGGTLSVPFDITFTQYQGDWFDGAKLYRAWLESEATGPGEILEKGRFEDRTDVSEFVKDLDLVGVSNTQWYEGTPDQRAALRHLDELPGYLGASDVAYFFWGTSDRASSYGLPNTWLPWSTFAEDASHLLTVGIRSLVYTNPQVWDERNLALAETGAWQHLVEDRTGNTIRPPLSDTASDFYVDFFEQLASAHASTWSGAHGFYTDNPYALFEDFARPDGEPLGLTRSAYTGLCEINLAMRRGGAAGGGEFMTMHESGSERLVRCSDVEAAGGQFEQLYTPFFTAHMTGWYAPFFQAVFSGYTLLLAGDGRVAPETLPCGLWGSTLEESFENMARFKALSASIGGVPTWTHELQLAQGKLLPEWAPANVAAPFLAHVSQLIAARDRARPWLVFGELLRDPAVGGDRAVMHLRAPYSSEALPTCPFDFAPEDYDAPKVATGAFRASDGTVRILVANGGLGDDEDDAASTTLDLSRIGLAGVTTLADPIAGVQFPVVGGRVTLSVPAGSVWVLQ